MGLVLGCQRAGRLPRPHPKETLVGPRVSEAAGGQRAYNEIEKIYKSVHIIHICKLNIFDMYVCAVCITFYGHKDENITHLSINQLCTEPYICLQF